MAATELLEKLVTYAEYKALDVDDNFLYELLDGELVQKSAPPRPGTRRCSANSTTP